MPTIVREICHMMGMRSCIYFECTMNSTNSAEENERNEKYGLCPVCLCKLRLQLKFDCLERFNNLTAVCAELGLVTESWQYEQLLTDWMQNEAFSNDFYHPEDNEERAVKSNSDEESKDDDE